MPDPSPQLKQVLAELRDINKDKRRTAIMKLGMLGGDEAVRALVHVVRNRNEDLIARGRAALMLGKLRDLRAVDPLIEALDAPGLQTPVHAAQSLGELGDARAIPPLLDMLHSEHDKFREVALEALRKLGYCEEPALAPLEATPSEG